MEFTEKEILEAIKFYVVNKEEVERKILAFYVSVPPGENIRSQIKRWNGSHWRYFFITRKNDTDITK